MQLHHQLRAVLHIDLQKAAGPAHSTPTAGAVAAAIAAAAAAAADSAGFLACMRGRRGRLALIAFGVDSCYLLRLDALGQASHLLLPLS